jgi:hypothetical protein
LTGAPAGDSFKAMNDSMLSVQFTIVLGLAAAYALPAQTIVFQAARVRNVSGFAQGVAIADFNQDGKPDMAVAVGPTQGGGLDGVLGSVSEWCVTPLETTAICANNWSQT